MLLSTLLFQMIRATVLIAMLFCITFQAATAGPTSRDVSLDLGFESEEDQFPEGHSMVESASRIDGLGEVGSILFAVRNQFKGIIEEIGLQLFSYLAKVLQHFKVKLLRKLGMYTLSDVFHTVFDGVTDFVVESGPYSYDNTKDIVKVKPVQVYNRPYDSSLFFKSN